MNQRLRLKLRGAVQGVGYRPLAYRLAAALGLSGWVVNASEGLVIEVEGPPERLDQFRLRLASEAPPHAVVEATEVKRLGPVGYRFFEIRSSRRERAEGAPPAHILPDIATCSACRVEILDPSARRYLYPFTNCTECGPRFTIIEALPYDRARTSMKRFAMCPACSAEYGDPLDRRFHAQPIACAACGPQISLVGRRGHLVARGCFALLRAVSALSAGAIVAVKGLGGFHLMTAAGDDGAVARLRARKRRETKPLAVMAPSLEAAQGLCRVTHLEAALLSGPEAPIVLLDRLELFRGATAEVAHSVGQGPTLGVMLPYTPLHHLLLGEFAGWLVATSGNISDEPICIENEEALSRLDGVADLFLVHDRPIVHRADDSVVRVVLGRPQMLRRARGYAPRPINLALEPPAAHDRAPTILAMGAHLKNTVALRVSDQVFLSPHVGDMETAEAARLLTTVAEEMPRLFEAPPDWVAVDAHPDYHSTRLGRALGAPVVEVQHHHAHVAATVAEHALSGPVFGVVWDGTGYGLDATIWGGEFLVVEGDRFRRAGHLRPFRLPGGDAAARDPRRPLFGIWFEMFGGSDTARPRWADRLEISSEEWAIWQEMTRRGLNAPLTTSAGRLFDAVAALLGVARVSRFEGEAAMALEWAAVGEPEKVPPYEFELRVASPERPFQIDWGPMVVGLLEAAESGAAPQRPAARFHATLAAAVVAAAEQAGVKQVVLTGGCFQNRRLLTSSAQALASAGFRVYWPERVPPNDGGIALGQAAVVAFRLAREGADVPSRAG